MKISYNWLKDYIKLNDSPEKMAEILTNTGLEVEGVENFEEVKGGLRGLVVGEVLSCEKHQNADKLSVTRVDIGNGTELPIVCGAPNVAAGQKVVVAKVGTVLYAGKESFTIRKTKIRGEVSEGMICAEDEIGLGTSHEGIMVLDEKALPGTPAADYYNISSDVVFEIGLTPNRIDAGSHFGVARDLAAYYAQTGSLELQRPDISSFSVDTNDFPIPVAIEDTEGCRRFTGVTITGVKVGPSPKWLQLRLKAIGLSPINNVVDITNFVMHELGQPLHAYDADRLEENRIVVKRLPEGTPFVTLDEEERKLSGEDVMVCDGKYPVCIAGVFGGLHSGVTEKTRNIFLESAYFDPVAVRKTAKHHGLSTDSSFRFERGVDPENTLNALKRAAILIRDVAQGKISSEVQDVHPAPLEAVMIEVRFSHIDRLIGQELDKQVIRKILESLDFEIISNGDDMFKVKAPLYRVDVTREADVIEEILRIYGYNNIEIPHKLNASVSFSDKPDNEKLVNQVSDMLSAVGFSEIMCNSLTKKEYYNNLKSFPEQTLVPLMNPLSNDLNVLRQTMLFGGLESIARNINHKNPDLRLYEFGRNYFLKGADLKDFSSFNEVPSLALFLTGNYAANSWTGPDTPASFFQLKAHVLNILKKLGINTGKLKQAPMDATDIFDGGLNYSLQDKTMLRIGTVSGSLLKKFEIDQPVFFAEMNWEALVRVADEAVNFKDLPRYPEVRRDLSLLLDEDVQFAQIEELAGKVERKLLKNVNLFDFYKGKNIPEGKKSYAVSFTLQSTEKTLTDKEIDKIMQKIESSLKENLKAELR